MAFFKMKFYGSCQGRSGNYYQFSKGQIIEAPDREFGETHAEDVTADFSEERKTVDVNGIKAETGALEPKKRGRKPKPE